jgi:hypothetical protein
MVAPWGVRSSISHRANLVLLQLWDLLALLVVYYFCTRWGGAWLRDNWPAVAGPVAGALFVAEVRRTSRSGCGSAHAASERIPQGPC